MVCLDELLRVVDVGYARMEPPSWSDPHQQVVRAPEEYERVSNPRIPRVAHLRTRAWLDALVEVGVAAVEVLGRGHRQDGLHEFVVRSPRPGTLPLLVATGDREPTRLAVVDPQLRIRLTPTCGCDACDVGSEPLILAVDDTFEAAVTGALEVTQDHERRRVHFGAFGTTQTMHGLAEPLTGTWHGTPWVA